jgi:hypothetical protein
MLQRRVVAVHDLLIVGFDEVDIRPVAQNLRQRCKRARRIKGLLK